MNTKIQANKDYPKWKKNGDLSEIDMLRVLNKLSPEALNSCV